MHNLWKGGGIGLTIDPEHFYERLKHSGMEIRDILWPLAGLNPRERAVFTEYHYWNTHMKVIAESHRISLGRTYEILYRAEEKVASARSQKEAEEAQSF
jgi:DNA-directed RNA polymerase specialized sigma24 family protein